MRGFEGWGHRNILKDDLDRTLLKAENLTRLELLRAEIDARILELGDGAEKALGEHLEGIGSDEYMEAMYVEYRKGNPETLKKMINIGIRVDPKEIRSIALTNWSGRNYAESIWRNYANLADDVQTSVIRNMIQGKSLDKCAEELGRKLDDNCKYAAERLVRTETDYMHNKVHAEALKDSGYSQYEFKANLDSRTSETCADLHGKTFDLDDYTPGRNAPPMHPNCRSYIAGVHKKSFLKPKQKKYLLKNPDGGYTEVKADMSKAEWEKKYKGGSEKESGIKKDVKGEVQGFGKYTSDDLAVDLKLINSKEYKKKFDNITDDKDVNNAIYESCKSMLIHRSKTDKEDMVLINSKSGKIEGRQTASKHRIRLITMIHYQKQHKNTEKQVA